MYLPSGFAPSRRTRMDDGLIDVRILETGRRFSRLRILVSLALGRLERSPLYHELRVPEFSSPRWTGRPCSPTTARSEPSAPKPLSACTTGRYRYFVRCLDAATADHQQAGTNHT